MVALTAATLLGPTALAAGALGAGNIASTLEQREASKEARRAREQANAVQRSAAAVEASRRRRLAVAQARIARAQNIAQGLDVGAATSLQQGAQASLAANLGTNLASQTRTFASGQQAFDLRQQAQSRLERGQERASLFQAFDQTAQTAASLGAKFI